MGGKDKFRMCPFCEGTIAADASECKYCGSSLVKQAKASSIYQTADSLASLYEPPYSPTRKSGSRLGVSVDNYAEEEDNIHITEQQQVKTKATSIRDELASDEEDEESSHLGALLLLSIGTQLFTLAWLLFFFSDHGKLTLEWKSRYWFIYALSALPLIYQGWKRLRRV